MRSSQLSSELQARLVQFVEAASRLLRADLASGAEVPFELASHGRRGGATATLYCYEPLTGPFIAERAGELQELPEHAAAVSALKGRPWLDRYLASRGLGAGEAIVVTDMRTLTGSRARAKPAPTDVRAAAVLQELLADVFAGQTAFDVRPERVHEALARLQRAELDGASDTVTIVATLHGLTINSRELTLTQGLTIAVPEALSDVPEATRTSQDGRGDHLLVALVLDARQDSSAGSPANAEVAGSDGRKGADKRSGAADPSSRDPAPGRGGEAAAIAGGREVLRDLLRALRLFGDGRVAFGELAWVRAGGHDGRWRPLALGGGGRPHGMLVVTAEQEDELRAFCNLVSRRLPHANEVAWALRRFELGCERESTYEALSDHLLALRVLLEPEGPASGLLAGRLAALCATSEHRARLTLRMTKALALERAVIAGSARASAAGLALARDVADHLRALLRDIICGHLKPDLTTLADELLTPPQQSDQETTSDPDQSGELSGALV